MPVTEEAPPSQTGNGSLRAGGAGDDFVWAARSEAGEVRPHNEDCAGAWVPVPGGPAGRGPVFVVCDGLGGHAAGEVASRAAVDAVLGAWTGGDAPAPVAGMRAAARAANTAVFDRAATGGRRGMATTLTAMTLAGREAVVAHVGDSRGYLVRRGDASQLTADHSRVGEMLRLGLLSPEQAARHPGRSQLTRTIGTDPVVAIDVARADLETGDALVLCSDGLWDLVARHEIARLVDPSGPVGSAGTGAGPGRAAPAAGPGGAAAAAEALVGLALARGAPDNVTVLLVQVVGDGPLGPGSERRSRLRWGRR